MATGAYVRVERDGKPQNLEIDELRDYELDQLEKDQPNRGWQWAKYLAKWIRDNVSAAVPAVLICFTFCMPAFAKLPEVHLVEARGTTYEVKEVDRTYREKISRWNMLILKRGEEHTEYKLIGTENTLDVSTKDVPAEKRKKIPDRRPLNVKHPNLCLGGRIGMWFVTNLASSAIAK